MADLPDIDAAIYMVIDDILAQEPSPAVAEFLCVALLAGFKKTDDLMQVVQQSADPEKTIQTIQQATRLMAYDRTNPDKY